VRSVCGYERKELERLMREIPERFEQRRRRRERFWEKNYPNAP
jgi:hypothetical protein